MCIYIYIYICVCVCVCVHKVILEQRLVFWGAKIWVIVRREVFCEHVSNCVCPRDGAVRTHKCKSTVTGNKEETLLTVIVC